jgi:hypothetical protein
MISRLDIDHMTVWVPRAGVQQSIRHGCACRPHEQHSGAHTPWGKRSPSCWAIQTWAATALKGFFDRAFLPGFAVRYRKDSQFWDKLLSGRSAQVFSTMDTPPWYFRFVYRMPGHNQIKRTILEFSGIKPVKITSFGPVRYATAERRAQWLAQVARSAQGV